jgi:hypothetical protein
MSRRHGRKPEKLKVGPVTARPMRPRGPAGPQDGRWYWRAEVWKGRGKQSETLWTD